MKCMACMLALVFGTAALGGGEDALVAHYSCDEGSGRCSTTSAATASQALELTSGRDTGSLPLALWASEALRPPNTPQVRSARFFGGEPFVELLQSSGVVHAADGVSLIIANRALILRVVAGRGKWIPP